MAVEIHLSASGNLLHCKICAGYNERPTNGNFSFCIGSLRGNLNQIGQLFPKLMYCFVSFKQCAKSTPGNVIISPLSVADLLALLSQAADGQTYTELRDGLYLNGADKTMVANQFYTFAQQLHKHFGNAKFSMANQIYVQQGHKLSEKFQTVASSKFDAGVEMLNFGNAIKSAEIINGFVAEKTNGKITKLVESDSLSQDMMVYLVNAIYFKGIWQYPFDKKLTRQQPFHTSDNRIVSIDFMVSMRLSLIFVLGCFDVICRFSIFFL